MPDWVSFWNSENWIYANERHRQVHYRRIADDVCRHLPCREAVVLDYGCGEALSADRVASAVRRLILCDAAPKIRSALEVRFENSGNIDVRSPAELASIESGSIHLVIMHSVAQYLTIEELRALLILFRRLLAHNGLFLLGDVLPPNVSAAADARALLQFAVANGFFFAALAALARTALSDYRLLRKVVGLRRYSEQETIGLLAEARFSAFRAPTNLGHNPARMTFIARPT